MRRCSILTVCLAAILYAVPARAATITLDSVTVDSLETFKVSVGIEDLTGVFEDLVAYSFTIGFDPRLLELIEVTEGDALSSGGTTLPCTFPGLCRLDSVDQTLSEINIGNFLLLDVGDKGVDITTAVLNVLTFKAAAQGGVTTLTLTLLSMTNSAGLEIEGIEVPLPATVTINEGQSVPEPSLVLLFGFGAAALADRRLRRAGARTNLPRATK